MDLWSPFRRVESPLELRKRADTGEPGRANPNARVQHRGPYPPRQLAGGGRCVLRDTPGPSGSGQSGLGAAGAGHLAGHRRHPPHQPILGGDEMSPLPCLAGLLGKKGTFHASYHDQRGNTLGHYDSQRFDKRNAARLAKDMMPWLREHGVYSWNDKEITPEERTTQLQTDSWSCGLHVIENARHFFREATTDLGAGGSWAASVLYVDCEGDSAKINERMLENTLLQCRFELGSPGGPLRIPEGPSCSWTQKELAALRPNLFPLDKSVSWANARQVLHEREGQQAQILSSPADSRYSSRPPSVPAPLPGSVKPISKGQRGNPNNRRYESALIDLIASREASVAPARAASTPRDPTGGQISSRRRSRGRSNMDPDRPIPSVETAGPATPRPRMQYTPSSELTLSSGQMQPLQLQLYGQAQPQWSSPGQEQQPPQPDQHLSRTQRLQREKSRQQALPPQMPRPPSLPPLQSRWSQ